MNLRNLFISLVGRENVYRLGRALYMHARNDISNDISSNGERMIQQAVLSAWAKAYSGEKLVVFDCGANVGDWSLPLLTDCKTNGMKEVDLYAFEPVPSTANVLRERLRDFPSAKIHGLALSAELGLTSMYIVGDGAGTNSIHSESNEQKNQVLIKRTTAFSFCRDNSIEKIHLFKCDTEGHDMEVLKGALPLLKEGRIIVFQFEYNHRWVLSRHFLKDVFDAIFDLPYRLGKVCPGHIELYSKWYPELERFFEGNYILVKRDALQWFRVAECSLTRHFAVLPPNR